MSGESEILIVGGGPAGTSAGIRAAQRGMAPVVFEPRDVPIDKACGEGLMPAALLALEELGVHDLEGQRFRGIRYRDALDESMAAIGEFRFGHGLGVRRKELHRSLAERARDVGVEWVQHRVESVAVSDDHVEVDGRRGDYLIVADGLNSSLRDRLGLEASVHGPRRYGVRRHFETSPWTSYVEVHWSDVGEAYVTPVGPNLVGVAILSEGGGRFDELIGAFPTLQRRIGLAGVASTDRGAGPFLQRASSVVDGRALLVGDAAGYVDALTGEGVALAVHTAKAAVDAIASGAPESYHREWRRITRAYRWMTRLLVELASHRAAHRPLIWFLKMFPKVFDESLALLGGRPPRSEASVSTRQSSGFVADTPRVSEGR